MGCWSQTEVLVDYGVSDQHNGWSVSLLNKDGSEFEVYFNNDLQRTVNWSLLGLHNVYNAVMAIAAARHAGVPVKHGIDALAEFKNVKRRMEIKGKVNNITVYDDFAHHPTAIATTIDGLKKHIPGHERIIAILEPRSNTMKMQVHNKTLPGALASADKVFFYLLDDYATRFDDTLEALGDKGQAYNNLDDMLDSILAMTESGDHLLVMSNGGFGGIHQKLLDGLL